MKNKPSISVVIPVLNEEGSLTKLYKELVQALNSYPEWEIIFIDDGSKDNSVEIIRSFIQSNNNIKLIKFHKNYGKADALHEGFKIAQYSVVITMDADLQDDPNEIDNLVMKIHEGWDMVSGWKKDRHDPLEKRLPSKIFNKITRLFTGVKIHDFNCGLKAYRLEVIKSIDIFGGRHRYIPALAKQQGFSITEIVVNHRPRLHGETKYGSSRYFHGFFDLLTISFMGKYYDNPLHFFGLIGLILSLIGGGIITYLSLGWFAGIPIGNRPLFFIGILSMILGVQFFSIGLLGEIIIKSRRGSLNKINCIEHKILEK